MKAASPSDPVAYNTKAESRESRKTFIIFRLIYSKITIIKKLILPIETKKLPVPHALTAARRSLVYRENSLDIFAPMSKMHGFVQY